MVVLRYTTDRQSAGNFAVKDSITLFYRHPTLQVVGHPTWKKAVVEMRLITAAFVYLLKENDYFVCLLPDHNADHMYASLNSNSVLDSVQVS